MRKSLLGLAVAATFATSLLSAAAHAETSTYTLDPTHTFVSFEIGHFGTSTNKGRFDKKEGSVQMDRAAKTGKLEVTVDTTSINSGTPAFDKHLQSADLFNAAKYPTIKFVSDKFIFNGDKVAEIVGNLTLLGKTQTVTLKANQFNCYQSPMIKREVCGGDFETTIDRTDFGMNYGVDWGFPKNVRLIVQAEGIKQ
ncbi:MAG: YceI family protein [Rhodoferax sp.]